MNTPKEILNRAHRLRRPAAPVVPQTPAPVPQRPAEPAPDRTAAPAGSRGLYRELMRSHDRMGTRHLKGPG